MKRKEQREESLLSAIFPLLQLGHQQKEEKAKRGEGKEEL